MAKTDEITTLKEQEAQNQSNIVKTDIVDEMQKAYLDYAMSVIVSRALPDVRDGLKPVQRRIIYAMQDKNITVGGKFIKCATVVGEVMGKYHPHGDASIYDALVRMGQDFSLRYQLIFPQGNFGSIDGDPPAAMRYTECKMQKITEELYKDIGHETVDFELNDLQTMEPTFLPSLLPNILLNGATGIAVGMATNIPPHNLGEVIDAISFMIEKAATTGAFPSEKDLVEVYDNYKVKVAKTDFLSTATVEDLVQYIKGPDFPTGATIYDQKEIMHMYATGKGRVVTRAKMEIEESKSGKTKLIVTEIPFQVNKSTLISKIAALVKEKKISGISDLRDESNRKGMRIVIELKKDAIVKKVQNRLYKYSQLQSSFSTNMVALVNGEPKLMTLKMVLEEFIKHRQLVTVKRTIYFLAKIKDREHILLGLKIAIDNIDEVIALIRASKDVETAKAGLISKFGLSERQAQAILDMQLRRLAALERQKIEDELKEIANTIEDYEILLSNPDKILESVKNELEDLKNRYADERKTKVVKSKLGQIEDSDLIPNEKCIITISTNGYVKRLKEDAYKPQGRGGKGSKGQELKEEDLIDTIRPCNTHDWGLFFTNKGKVYKLRIWEIPETSKQSRGTPVVNFLSINRDEKVEAFLVVDEDTLQSDNTYIAFGTKNGNIKKTPIKDYENIRSSGIIAINIKEDDSLIWAQYMNDEDDIMLITAKGQSIRFSGQDVRPMGRVAAGVRGVKLAKQGDMVVGMAVIPTKRTDLTLLTVSSQGYGKRTDIDEYKVQNRGGSGILTYKVSDKTKNLISAKLLFNDEQQDILIATKSGKFIRLEDNEIPIIGRATLGVKLMNIDKEDTVTSIAVLKDEVLDQELPKE